MTTPDVWAKYIDFQIETPLSTEDLHLCQLISTKLDRPINIPKFIIDKNMFSMDIYNVFTQENIQFIAPTNCGPDIYQKLLSPIFSLRLIEYSILYLPMDPNVCHISIQNNKIQHMRSDD